MFSEVWFVALVSRKARRSAWGFGQRYPTLPWRKVSKGGTSDGRREGWRPRTACPPPERARSPSAPLLLPHRFRLLLARVPAGPAHLLRGLGSESPAGRLFGHRGSAGAGPGGLRHERGHGRGGGRGRPAAQDGAVAGRDKVVPVRRPRHPGRHGARHDRPPPRCPGLVGPLGPTVRPLLPDRVRLHGPHRGTAVRRTGVDRFRAAPPAAAARPPSRRPDPRRPVGALAPAELLEPLAGSHRHTA